MDSLNPYTLPQLEGMFLKIYLKKCYDNCLNGSALASSPMGWNNMGLSILVGPSDPFYAESLPQTLTLSLDKCALACVASTCCCILNIKINEEPEWYFRQLGHVSKN
jgi:hypothetical protein